MSLLYKRDVISSSLYVEKISSVMICGPDAGDFLHRLTTQNFRGFNESEKRNGAIIAATSHIKYLFTAEFREGCFVLSTDASYAQALAEDLEKMHFAENLTIQVLPGIIENPKLTEEERISKGLFKFGVDITEKNLLLEAPLNSYLHRNKGCYPGQEVVERIFTYGQVAKKLVSIRLQSPVEVGASLSIDGKKIGVITSQTNEFALALVKKNHYEPGSKIDQGSVIRLNDGF